MEVDLLIDIVVEYHLARRAVPSQLVCLVFCELENHDGWIKELTFSKRMYCCSESICRHGKTLSTT